MPLLTNRYCIRRITDFWSPSLIIFNNSTSLCAWFLYHTPCRGKDPPPPSNPQPFRYEKKDGEKKSGSCGRSSKQHTRSVSWNSARMSSAYSRESAKIVARLWFAACLPDTSSGNISASLTRWGHVHVRIFKWKWHEHVHLLFFSSLQLKMTQSTVSPSALSNTRE